MTMVNPMAFTDFLTQGLTPDPQAVPQGPSQLTADNPLVAALQQATSGGSAPSAVDTEDRVANQARSQYEDLLNAMKARAYGMKPGQTEPTKGQKVKRTALEILKGLLQGNAYEPLDDRLRERADKQFQLENQRIGVTVPVERMVNANEIAKAKLEQNAAEIARKSDYDQRKGENAANRNALMYAIGLGRNNNMADRNGIAGRLVDSQVPLNQARTALLSTQNANQQASGGQTGLFGEVNRLLGLPNQQGPALDLAQKFRDAMKFAPKPGGSGASADKPRMFTRDEEIFNPDTNETEKQTRVFAVRPSEAEAGKVISGSPNALSTKEADRVKDFGQASVMARDLAHLYGRAIASGNAKDFMGLMQGNPISADLRAKGLFGKMKTPQEALSQILSANGLFQHLNAFAGRRITNRELDYIKKNLGKQSDDPQSALAASIAASQALETAKLRNAKVLSSDVDVTPMMEAEAKRFINEVTNGRPTELRSMRELLAQNGLLKGSQSSSSSGNSDPKMSDKLKELQEAIRKRKTNGR